MKKRFLVLAAIPLVLALSSCFSMQGFMLLKPAIAPGKTTTARFTVHPHLDTKNPPYSTAYQFALVGVSAGLNTSDPALTIGKATWGANGKFGGPQNMLVSSTLPGAIGSDCDGEGFDYSGVSGSLTWKGFLTANKIGDKQKVSTSTTIDVVVKAIKAAPKGDFALVIGTTGAWIDDGDGLVNSPDTFICTGNASTYINILSG
jgi:hypothetical protein